MNKMSDTTRNIIMIVVGLVALMIFFLIILGLIWIINGGQAVNDALTTSWHALIVIGAILVMFGIVGATLLVAHVSTNNLIRFQAADDRGEAFRHVMKGIGSQDKEIARLANSLAKEQVRVMLSQNQLPGPAAPAAEEPAEAQWWQLAVVEDDNNGIS